MRLTKFFLTLLIPVFIFSSASYAEEAGGPKLWKVSDEDTTIYIFGTIHLLNKEVDWITPALQNALAEADALVLEISPDQDDPAIIQPLIGKYGLLPAGETLQDRLSPENYEKMVGVLEGLQTPGNALDPLQPWLASLFLSLQVAGAHGFLPEYGVEAVLEESANRNEIPIYGLETADFQMAAMTSLSPEAQDELLRLTLEDIDQIDELFVEMRDLWLAGDMAGLDALVNEEFNAVPGMAEILLYQRNRNWVIEIEEILEVPGTYLIAVGTGHLVGDQNVLQLLEEKGIPVVLE